VTLKIFGEEESCQLTKHILLQEQSSLKVAKIPRQASLSGPVLLAAETDRHAMQLLIISEFSNCF
jgi:hypothetical protein